MTDAWDDHAGTIVIGGRVITNLQFADDINGLAGNEEENIKHFSRTVKAFGMEINAKKTKVMTNNAEGFRGSIRLDEKET